MTSSTSSSERASSADPWRRFAVTFAAVTAGLLAFLYLFVILVDPFDTLATGVSGVRHPIATNQRYSYPALARSPAYDSVVIGTSTSRLLDTEALNRTFGGRFANLAMNSATAWEQAQILDLFIDNHPDARQIVWGLDSVWCAENAPRLTFRSFPEWMYNDAPLDDYLNHFNFFAIEQAGRQFAEMTGLRDRKYGQDGYTPFVPPDAEYDASRVTQTLWGGATPPSLDAVESAAAGFGTEMPALKNDQIAYIGDMLDRIPDDTAVHLFFVPYHLSHGGYRNAEEHARTRACKQSVLDLVADRPNVTVTDFMIPSEYTASDRNYWDSLHTTIGAASELVRLLDRAVQDGAPHPAYRILKPRS